MSRFIRTLLALSPLAAAPAALHAQDVLTAEPRHFRVLSENAHVRVIEGTLQPGEKDALHTHAAGWYYVVHGGRMRIVAADGKASLWTPKAGESFWGEAEAPHTSENVGRTPLTYVLVEVKSTASAALQRDPASRDVAGAPR